MVRYRCEDCSLTLRGHAGSAPRGEDLVCAAVTGIVYALAAYVQDMEARGRLAQAPVIWLEPGDAQITAKPVPDGAEQLRGAFQMAQAGLRVLAEAYPEGVRWEI